MTELKTTEQKFSDALEVAPDAMVVVDAEGKIVIVNSQTERLFGYLKSEMVNERIQMLVPGRQLLALHRMSVLFKCNEASSHDLFGQHKNGTKFPVEIRLSNVETAEGVLVCSAIRDVSERRKHDLVLAAKNSELEAAVSELDAFCYSVSHDLRAPLRAMDGFSRILLECAAPVLDPKLQEHLRSIRRNAVKMDHLVDELLAFARLGRKPLIRQSVHTAQLVEHVVEEARQQFNGRAVNVTIGKLPEMWGDRTLLEQVFANLVGNAFKYTRARDVARIEIGARAVGGEDVFFVRDNGAGFDLKYADKLFGVFQRLHREEEFEGTGVGLALVQRIVQRHGGRIWAESEVDKGATFSFTVGVNP